MTPSTRPDATAQARHLAEQIEAEAFEPDVAHNFAPNHGWFYKGVAEQIIEAALTAATAAQEAYRDKGERVFEAVVYAFEGRPVPDDLREHGMVRRALKYRAAQEADTPRECAMTPTARTIAEQAHAAMSGCYCTSNDGEPYVGGRPVTNCKHRREAEAIIAKALTAARAEAEVEVRASYQRVAGGAGTLLQTQQQEIATLKAERDAARAELARRDHIIELLNRDIERRLPCPDHRDKFTDSKCQVCDAERRGKAEGAREALEQDFRAGFAAGLLAIDKFGEQVDTVDEALADWRRARAQEGR